MEFAYCKLEIFIPESHLGALQQALAEVMPDTSARMIAACPITR